jgi:AcrR family transcriptional regulator
VTDAPRTLRADARRNREQLLASAAELFAERGAAVSLEAVARHAGVGIGTLYRHFPTRDALVSATYRNEVAQLGAAAGELLETHAPAEALAAWMDRFVAYAATKRGMSEALQSVVASESDLFRGTRDEILQALGTLLAAGVRDGSLRSDVDAEDVLRGTSGIWVATQDPDWRERADRLVRLIVDGLRATR